MVDPVIYPNRVKAGKGRLFSHPADPAVEYATGDKFWYQHGKVHRTDGPAIEFVDGHKSWYLNGRYLSFDEWLNKVKMSAEDKVMMKLKYG
tara:strand:- start:478 stop:750 length:273 start_codon:yes stop_codon:yes gene_type:complete